MAEATADSPFWRFSIGFYRDPEVAAACIELQDQAGVDVNILMFLLWSATLNRILPKAEVEHLERRIGAWRERRGSQFSGGDRNRYWCDRRSGSLGSDQRR